MTCIAAAYDSPACYAIGADSHGEVDGARIASVKLCEFAADWRIGGCGTAAEYEAAFAWLRGVEYREMAGDDGVRSTLGRLFAHVRASVPRAADSPGIDSSYLLVGPLGIYTLDSWGKVSRPGARWATGSGMHVALGAMFERRGEPCDVVALAVRAAIRLVASCHGEPMTCSFFGAPGVPGSFTAGE